MAAGLALMGVGGGAMIAAPRSNWLMRHFASASNTGVTATFVTLGIVYFLFMQIGVFLIRIPAPGWKPVGYVPKTNTDKNSMITWRNIDVATASRTNQFWLLWIVLCTNVTAGIAVLAIASPLIQELFT